MTDLTPEQKIQQELNDKFHAAIINDEGIRQTFIDVLTGPIADENLPDEQMESVYSFVKAVDYMISTLGYGICDMHAKGGPAHLSETSD